MEEAPKWGRLSAKCRELDLLNLSTLRDGVEELGFEKLEQLLRPLEP